MIDNWITWAAGNIMPPSLHRLFSRRTGWMFAAVWIRSENRHRWVWVHEERYYSGDIQSIHTALNPTCAKGFGWATKVNKGGE